MSFSESLVSSISKMVDSYSSKEVYITDSCYFATKVFDSLEKIVKYVFDSYYDREKIKRVVIYSTEISDRLSLDVEYESGYKHRRNIFKQYVNTNPPTKDTKPDVIILDVRKSDYRT